MKSEFVTINGSKIHYLQAGSGNPVLFLHGMPTSSYLWRNVIPYVQTLGKCIAPDLIGMGKSDRPDIEYSIDDHIDYIEKFIDALNLKNLTIVMHGWGSIIGSHYATKHEANCRGLVFYEAYLRPFHQDDISLPYQEQIAMLQEQENNSDLILNSTYFVDKTLPQGIMQTLAMEHLEEYRKPFLTKGSGKVLNQYIKEVPNGKKTGHVDKLIADYSKKLTHSKLPKLLLYSVPGFITTIATAIWARDNLPNIELIDIGEELHYAQESNPDLIGEAITIWLQGIETHTS